MSKAKLVNGNEVTNIKKPYFRNYGVNHNGSFWKYAVPRPTPRNPPMLVIIFPICDLMQYVQLIANQFARFAALQATEQRIVWTR